MLKEYHIYCLLSKSLTREKQQRGREKASLCFAQKEVAQPCSWGCFSPQAAAQGLCTSCPAKAWFQPCWDTVQGCGTGTWCMDRRALHCTALPFARSKLAHQRVTLGKDVIFNGLHPLLPASTPPCSSWWRRARRKWEKQRGSGGRLVLVTVPAISANHHSLAFMFQREL